MDTLRKIVANRLVGVAEVASMAGVSGQAVGHWRTRGGGFPDPIAILRAGPIFDKREVEEWLRKTGRVE